MFFLQLLVYINHILKIQQMKVFLGINNFVAMSNKFFKIFVTTHDYAYRTRNYLLVIPTFGA